MSTRGFGGWGFSEREITTLHQTVFSLFLLLITVKEKAHRNVQYYFKCPQELPVAFLGFEQFQCQYSWLLGVHEIGTILGCCLRTNVFLLNLLFFQCSGN